MTEVDSSEKIDASLAGQGTQLKATYSSPEEAQTRMSDFRKEFKEVLFLDAETGKQKRVVSFTDLYNHVMKYEILMTKTQVWNLFLTPERRCDADSTQPRDANSGIAHGEAFEKKDLEDYQLNYLFHMYISGRKARKLRYLPDRQSARTVLTQKFVRNKAVNFVCYFTMLILLLLIRLGNVSTPDGDWDVIFNVQKLVSVAWVLVTFGIVFFMFELCGEPWFQPTILALVLTMVYIVFSLIMAIYAGSYIATPQYYENAGCYECIECTKTDGPLCWTSQPYEDYVDLKKQEYTDTCTCALKPALRGVMTIGVKSEGCMRNGDSVCLNCDQVLEEYASSCDNGHDNHDCNDELGKYDCVYYQPSEGWFFYIGTWLTALFALDFLIGLGQTFVWTGRYLKWQKPGYDEIKKQYDEISKQETEMA